MKYIYKLEHQKFDSMDRNICIYIYTATETKD